MVMAFRPLAGVFAVAAAVLIAPAPGRAQATQPACVAIDDAGLPAALAGWRDRSDLAAAGREADAGQAVLPLGKGVNGQLKRTGEVVFPVLPDRPGGSVSHGGLFTIAVAEAGDYQVSLGAGAWIEVVRDGALVQSNAHAPGPACTSLRKTVVFPLTPGRYLLEITGNGEPTLPVMVTRVTR